MHVAGRHDLEVLAVIGQPDMQIVDDGIRKGIVDLSGDSSEDDAMAARNSRDHISGGSSAMDMGPLRRIGHRATVIASKI